VFIFVSVYFVIVSVRELLYTPSYVIGSTLSLLQNVYVAKPLARLSDSTVYAEM